MLGVKKKLYILVIRAIYILAAIRDFVHVRFNDESVHKLKCR